MNYRQMLESTSYLKYANYNEFNSKGWRDIAEATNHTNIFIFEITIKDFKKIFNTNFDLKLKYWWEIFLQDLSKETTITPNTVLKYEYPPDYQIKNEITNDPVKALIYDFSKYYYFATANLQTYRVPLGVLRSTTTPTHYGEANTNLIHPGNARLNCMSWWKPHQKIKLLVTDLHKGELIYKLGKVSPIMYNLNNPADRKNIVSFLELEKWKDIFVRFSPFGLELGEQHCNTLEFNNSYIIRWTPHNVVVNDKRILTVDSVGQPRLIHYK